MLQKPLDYDIIYMIIINYYDIVVINIFGRLYRVPEKIVVSKKIKNYKT